MTQAVNRKVSFQTVGCRLNQYETERMAADLKPYGFHRVARGEVADLYIINTCTVTHRADSSSRYLINRAARENPNGRIVVAGCYVDSSFEQVASMEAVDVVISNREKERIAEILPRLFPDMFAAEPQPGCSTGVAAFEQCNRAWLKISDGCNQRCSFCILPRIRGRLKNRPPGEIIDEINVLVRRGFQEVVLTGVNIGYYRNRSAEPEIKNLADLCRLILSETDLARLRISSIEPQTVSEELLQLCADARICRHMHLPLQSGSARILRLMRRPYTPETFINRVRAIREAQPQTVVGADVIVGFPGETQEDFGQTKALVESGLVDYLHVFSYSDRPGADASEYEGKIAPVVIKDRNAILTRLSRRLRAVAHRRQIGRILEVIPEHKRPGQAELYGISDNYLRVKLPFDLEDNRQVVRVRATGATDEYVEAELAP
jgi:threonylcarbamoyladenosine tRNA methylthiotransferase MtaB